jgi:hypothetical protein
MKLSSMRWDLRYSRRRATADPAGGWVNPGSANVACLSGLTELVLQAKGDVGILSVAKRPDNKGYRTSYLVPDDVYAAHQVIGLSANLQQTIPVSSLSERYGKPDSVQGGEGGTRHHLYWVVVRQKQMPISVYEVDLEVKGGDTTVTRYGVRTTGFDYVQERLDALQREWERNYVLD